MNPIAIAQAWQRFKTVSNPQEAINRALQENPQIKQLLQESNNDPEKAFYALAKQKGINPDSILSMLK